MSCECAQCRQHYRTLGIAFGIPEESAIQAAYQEGLKEWNPELYQDYEFLRADAEEHFKQIQVAYRELQQHNGPQGGLPVEIVAARTESRPSNSAEAAPSVAPPVAPSLSLEDSPGCATAPNFTEEIKEMIGRHLGKADTPLAILDLSGARSYPSFSHFLLLSTRGMLLRDTRGIISLLWYKDLGEVILIDKRKSGKAGFMGIITGSQHNCSLHIHRNNGTRYLELAEKADDKVKEAIYDFLLRQKTQETR